MIYKSELNLHPVEIEKVPRELVERKAVRQFLESLPLEELKKMTNFEWQDAKFCDAKRLSAIEAKDRNAIEYWTERCFHAHTRGEIKIQYSMDIPESVVSHIEVQFQIDPNDGK